MKAAHIWKAWEAQVKNILHSSETFYIISNHCKKRMVKPKCSIYFPYIFSKFSSNFPQLFQMTKLNCFHHHRSTDVCKNTGIGKTFYSKECFLCKNSSTGCTTSASTAPVPAVATSHMTSLVCVCACVCQDEFLSHISSCALSQSINWQKCHNKTGSFEWHPSIHAKTTGEMVRRSFLLMLQQGLKQLDSNMCGTLKHQEAQSMKQTTGSTRSGLYGRTYP